MKKDTPDSSNSPEKSGASDAYENSSSDEKGPKKLATFG